MAAIRPARGGLAQVLRGGPAAMPVALGQPVGQAEVGQDDPLAQDGIAAAGVVLEPAIDPVGGGRVAGPHR